MAHLLRQHRHARVVDVAQQVLHAHLLRLVRAHLRRHVVEGTLRLLAALRHRLDRAIRLRRHALHLRPHVDDDEHGVLVVPPEERVDGEVAGLDLGSRRIEADDALLAVHLVEHGVHRLQVVVVEVEHRLVARILLEGHSKRVGDVHLPLVRLAQQHAHHAVTRVLRYAVVVVNHAEQHQRVHDDRGGRHGDRPAMVRRSRRARPRFVDGDAAATPPAARPRARARVARTPQPLADRPGCRE
mmetsp:Transcript_1574/g.4971  ORF Transcript_1574/g.4971 Transcript_1574/m.4971 type:complete len:242 (+) Transcript_1574:514-1239(+)